MESSAEHAEHADSPTMEAVLSSVGPSSTLGGKPRSSKPVRITGSFVRSTTETMNHRHLRRLQAFLNSYYLANFMAAIVLIDAYCTCVDIDATAAGTDPPQFFAVISDFCLVTYSLEVAAILFAFGWRLFLSDGMMILDIVIVGCGWTEKIIASFADGALGFRTAVLRALRLVRIFRLMRLLKLCHTLVFSILFKTISILFFSFSACQWAFFRGEPRKRIRPLRELHKLVMMMATCFRALLWSFLLCFVVMTVWAMLMVEVVNPHVREMHQDQGFFGDCHPQCTRAVSSAPWPCKSSSLRAHTPYALIAWMASGYVEGFFMLVVAVVNRWPRVLECPNC